MSKEYTYNNGEAEVPAVVVAQHGDTADLFSTEAGSNDVKLITGVPVGEGGLTYKQAK
jgi:hypothetical protein